MKFNNFDIDDTDKEDIIEQQEEQENLDKAYYDVWGQQMPEIAEKTSHNGNGNRQSSKHKNNEHSESSEENDFQRLIIESRVKRLREENRDLSLEEWSYSLLEKRQKFNDKLIEYFPDMKLLGDFELGIKTILNIQDVTLPFMGIVLAMPSSLKTALIECLRKLPYSYYSDKFNARSFVSHAANVSKEKLAIEVDILPAVKDKIILTPELASLFTQKDDDIKEQFGIITRVLDGHGLETNSGVHGKRGYYGNYMFTWLAAAVEIPHNIYKFLSTIGFKIYFLRLPRTKVTVAELVDQFNSENDFNQKMEEVEKLLFDYLIWFEVCPIAIGQNRAVKIEWDKKKDDKDAIRIIGELALLLAHIRGSVYVFRNSEHEDLIPVGNSQTGGDAGAYAHGVPIIEKPHRAMQQLYNLARGCALSYGRNWITKEDLSLVIKVVLSTGSIERVLVLDLLIAHKGILTTSQITTSMNIHNNSAKRTMTEFKGLELVTMDRVGDSSNSEHRIILNREFEWFLTEEFAELRHDSIDFAVRKNTPVCVETEDEDDEDDDNNTIHIKTANTHRGEIAHSKEGEEEVQEAFKLSEKGEMHFINNE